MGVPVHWAMVLLDRRDSQLVVVDTQPGFYGPDDVVDRQALAAVVARVVWLAGVATALGVPVTITEEDPARNGPTAQAVLANAPGATVHDKRIFGLADQTDILAGVQSAGRRTIVLAGLETDVCVAHSALGLLHRGFRVAVVVDATFAPGEMHEHGLRRMGDAGAVLIHAKGVYYEWLRTLAEARLFEAEHPDLAEPPGFSL
jgi:nicotinamidase-related amidase